MKLKQGQLWKLPDSSFIRIVRLERLEVEYKAMKDRVGREGDLHTVTKKQFCRLIKGAELMDDQISSDWDSVPIKPNRPVGNSIRIPSHRSSRAPFKTNRSRSK